MKTYLLAAAAVAVAFTAAPAAASVTVAGTATPSGAGDPGLIITGSPGTFSTSLDLGVPQVVNNLFTIGTTEDSIDSDDLFIPHNISVTFSFTNPLDAMGSPITGTASGFYSAIGSCSLFGFTGGGNGGCGQVQWNGPQTFSFGDGGSFSVALNDAIFATPGSANVSGTFTLQSASVPEPGTWATMLLGFGAIGFAMRRRRSHKPVLALSA